MQLQYHYPVPCSKSWFHQDIQLLPVQILPALHHNRKILFPLCKPMNPVLQIKELLRQYHRKEHLLHHPMELHA